MTRSRVNYWRVSRSQAMISQPPQKSLIGRGDFSLPPALRILDVLWLNTSRTPFCKMTYYHPTFLTISPLDFLSAVFFGRSPRVGPTWEETMMLQDSLGSRIRRRHEMFRKS